MKKSKIIVPAMAMIAFTSLASIAGSVAWFTASRQVSVSGGTYAVVKTTTNLLCTVANGVGTVADDSTDVISLGNNVLTDGSFNHSTKKIYQPNEAGTGLHETKPEIALENNANLATDLIRTTLDNGGKVYTAVTWDLSFTVAFGAQSGDYGLFLNLANTSFSAPQGKSVDKTGKGFRVAIVPKGEGSNTRRAVVYAGLQDAEFCKYIAGTSDTTISGSTYSAGDLIAHDHAAALDTLPTENTDKDVAIARADYLGTFAYEPSTQVTLAYTVVAWFEGTDPEIVNRDDAEEYQSVVCRLTFDAIKLKGTAQTSYTVHYHANNSTEEVMANTILTAGAGTIAANAFTAPSGKVFGGWATSQANAEEGTKAYDGGQEVTGISADLDLWAIWNDAPQNP